MADPKKYVPSYNYSDYQAANPTRPLPAPRVDIDFANIAESLDQTIDGLMDLRRSDGELKRVVGPEQLKEPLFTEFQELADEANDAADRAGKSANEAKISEDNAKSSENKAKESETAAGVSAQAAADSEQSVADNAQAAADSAQAAATSEGNAEGSAQAAAGSAQAAATSEGNAAGSAQAAASSAEQADEALVGLRGGSVGQVLVKATGKDYEYIWQNFTGGGDMLRSVYDPEGTGSVLKAVEAEQVEVSGVEGLEDVIETYLEDYYTKDGTETILDENAVLFSREQNLTPGHQAQARENISAFGKPLGNSSQYIQGDGTLDSKSNLPISTSMQNALDDKLSASGGIMRGTIWGEYASNGGVAIQLKSGISSGDQGAVNVSGIAKFKIPRGGLNDLDGAYGSVHYEEVVGLDSQLVFRTNGFATNRYWWMRQNGGFYAEGPINGSAKNFEIDHPADPDNYDLRHCATEAPEMLVEYRGKATLVNGKATVNVEEYFGVMPDTFKNLWADAWVSALQNQTGFDRLKPRYIDQVTFEIECENQESNDEVTWLLMARRNDPYVRHSDCDFTDDEGHLIVEFEKPE